MISKEYNKRETYLEVGKEIAGKGWSAYSNHSNFCIALFKPKKQFADTDFSDYADFMI